jgi:hypothetical protein
MIRKIGLGLLAALLAGSALWVNPTRHAVKRSNQLAKLDQIVRVTSEPVVDCTQIAAQHPFVILALGQSNAANHGERANRTNMPVALIADGKCIMATDPLPGSTGNGGSIWSRLPNYLSAPNLQRPLVLSVMGVDATSIADWTSDQSPLRKRLTDRIKLMKALGLLPQVILWQQGEADAGLGTTSEAYGNSLNKLADALTQAGSDAPIVMALSTVCRSAPNFEIRVEIAAKAAHHSRFKVGPDTDILNDAGSRFDGCHFSAAGLDQAAKLWAAELRLVFASI